MACNKIPGFAKSDAGDETGATNSGILSSFQTFEGEITIQVTMTPDASATKVGSRIPEGPKTLVVGIKSPKARVDLAGDVSPGDPVLGQGVGLIVDPPAKKAYALITAQRNAIVVDFEKIKDMAEQMRTTMRPQAPAMRGAPSAPPAPSELPKIDKTGKKDKVAGYECEEWKITTKDTHVDVCMAGISWIDLTPLGTASPELAFAAVAADGAHFPLRVAFFDEKGKLAMRAEATKIDKKKLDNANFVVPPGFTVVELSDMLRNMGMGGLPNRGILGMPPRKAPPVTPPR